MVAADQALWESTPMLQLLIDSSPVAICVIDEQVRVRLWSPAAEKLFGWKAEEVMGKPLPILPPEALPGVKAVRPDRQYALERRRLRKDGSWVTVSLWTTPLRDSNGVVVGTLGMYVDISERQKLEAQVRQAQKLDALGRMASGIAHDFNNILMVLTSHLDLARSATQLEEVQSHLQEMQKACARASNLVRQILTFSRKQEFSRQPLRLDSPVLDALEMLRSTLPAHIQVQREIADDLPAVMADPTHIHQVVINLVLNAVHAIGENAGCIRVRLEPVSVDASMARASAELTEGHYVRLSVSDTGCGMDRSMLERIFDPFFTTKPSGMGTGLGLAVVRGIVKSHDGAITVESEPGKGTQFRVYFPVAGATASVGTPDGTAQRL